MILSGKELSISLQQELAEKAKKIFAGKKSYLAIIFLGDNASSATYVKHKKAYGETIGVPVIVFGQNHVAEYTRDQGNNFDDVGIYIHQQYDSIGKIMELIKYLNYDKECVGIVVQLPLPEQFAQYKEQILSSISPEKDVDGLGGVVNGLSEMGLIDFVPATPKAVLALLAHYTLDNVKGKTISILGQSNLVGKPLAIEYMKMGAAVYTCNVDTPLSAIQTMTQQSDYIISCTGKIHLVDDHFVRDDKSQVVVDVGYGHKDGKPVGDVDTEKIADLVAAYSPVPGGVGPLTVACIFKNMFELQEYKEILKAYKL